MNSNDPRVIEAIRSLLLPITDRKENAAVNSAVEMATAEGIGLDDLPLLVRSERSQWEEQDTPPKFLALLVKAALSVEEEAVDKLLSENYFVMHKGLMDVEFRLTFNQALAFLSHTRLMITLAQHSQMTASQITRVLAARDNRVPFSRASVGFILRKLKLSSQLDTQQIQDLFALDSKHSQQVFADSNLEEAGHMVEAVARSVGVDSAFTQRLKALAPFESPSSFIPYLQILHYQCCISEFFDFAVKDMYEFAPRGQAALTLFELYPPQLVGAGNPFLNNAKSVEQLTPAWFRSKKKKEIPGAAALYQILEELQSLGFSARRELSSWIRMWIHRVLLIASEDTSPFPSEINQEQAEKLIAHVAAANTQTSGVIEQRMVDAGSTVIHAEERWRPRGLEDSVNTTNTSQRKLGDCDFQNSVSREVFAYEAHGGKLTRLYLQEHIRTFKKILPRRIEEWETFSEASGWRVFIVFIAHEIGEDIKDVEFEHDGVRVKIHSKLYSDFFSELPTVEFVPAMNRYLMGTLSRPRVPEVFRASIREVIEA